MHLTERYFDETVEFIVEMLQYASTQGEPEEGAPFGKETAACLSAFLAKAESLGFETEGISKADKRLSDGKYYNTVLMGRCHGL